MYLRLLIGVTFLATSSPALALAGDGWALGTDSSKVEKVGADTGTGASNAKNPTSKKRKQKVEEDEEEEDEVAKEAAKEDDDEDEEEEEKPAPKKRGMPRVHIEGNYEDIEIKRVDAMISVVSSRGSATGMVSHSVCTSPCDEIIDGRHGDKFFFMAPGMVGSSGFSLANQKGNIVAKVHGGSFGQRLGSFVLLSVGIVGALTGVTFLALSDTRLGTDYTTTGGVMLGVGAVAITGGVLLFLNSSTTFELVPATKKDAGIRFEGGRLLF